MLFGAASRPRPRGASIGREREKRRPKTADAASIPSPEISPVRESGTPATRRWSRFPCCLVRRVALAPGTYACVRDDVSRNTYVNTKLRMYQDVGVIQESAARKRRRARVSASRD